MDREPFSSPIKTVRKGGDAVIADVVGDVNLSCSLAFQKSLLALLKDKPAIIVVNLEKADYIDSSGVASLIKLLSKARKAGIKLVLTGLSERVRSVFEITRLDQIFQIAASEKEALQQR